MPIRRIDRRDIFAIFLIVVVVSLFHWRGLRPGHTFLAVDLAGQNIPWTNGTTSYADLQNWLISDAIYQPYPFLVQAVDTLRHGEWPLWNPLILMGHPAAADPLAQPFYPVFKVLGLLFEPARGFALSLWIHIVVAAVLTYGFLRTLHTTRRGAIVGAFTYALSGYLITWLEMRHRTSTLAWLPGVLWAYELAIQRRSAGIAALAGGIFGVAILGGQFQFVITFGIVLGLYALLRTAMLYTDGARRPWWPIPALGITAVLGSMVGAIQLLPAVEFLTLSHRVVSEGLSDPLPLQHLITLIVPDFFGNPSVTTQYWGVSNFNEDTIYAGIVALLLAGLAPLYARRRRLAVGLAAITLILVYVIVGGPGVQLLSTVPGVKYASLHRSASILPLLIAALAALTVSSDRVDFRGAILAGAVVAGLGAAALWLDWGGARSTHWTTIRWPVIRAGILLVTAIVLLAARSRLPRHTTSTEWALIGLVIVDLYAFGGTYNPAGPIEDLMPATPSITHLQEQAAPYRVVSLQTDGDPLFGPNVLSVFGIADAGGYSSLVSEKLKQLVAAGDPKENATDIGQYLKLNPNIVFFSAPSERLLDLLNAGYVASPDPLDYDQIRAEVVVDSCAGQTPEITTAHPAAGTFTVRSTAINRLDLRFHLLDSEPAGALTVRMWRGADRGQLILEERVEAASLNEAQPTTLYFAQETDAPGTTYLWEVASSESAPATGTTLCTDESGTPAVSVYGAGWEQTFTHGEVHIYRRLAPLPRAYVLYAAEHIEDDTVAVRRLLSKEFDVRNTAITANATTLPAQTDVPATPADIVAYENARVVIRATARQRGLLILGDQFHPGWQVSVDGTPAEVLRVNHILRGVILPSSEHEVEFRFAPAALQTGAGVTAAGLMLVVLTLVFDHRLSRRDHAED